MTMGTPLCPTRQDLIDWDTQNTYEGRCRCLLAFLSLNWEDPFTSADLAKYFSTTPSEVSSKLRVLEKRGLVTRLPDANPVEWFSTGPVDAMFELMEAR